MLDSSESPILQVGIHRFIMAIVANFTEEGKWRCATFLYHYIISKRWKDNTQLFFLSFSESDWLRNSLEVCLAQKAPTNHFSTLVLREITPKCQLFSEAVCAEISERFTLFFPYSRQLNFPFAQLETHFFLYHGENKRYSNHTFNSCLFF